MRLSDGDTLNDVINLVEGHSWREPMPDLTREQWAELIPVIAPVFQRSRPNVRKRVRAKTERGSEGQTRDRVRKRSGGWCERCGDRRAETMHHRRFRSQGGPWTPSNILHLCGDGTRLCHGELTTPGFAKRGAYEAAGWIVPSHQDWAEVPVLRRGVLVLLDDEGEFSVVEGSAA